MLDNQLRTCGVVLEKFRDWSWDPLVYTQLAGQALYSLLARDFRTAACPVTVPHHAAGALSPPARADSRQSRYRTSAGHHAETAVRQNPGVLSLVDELVVPNLGQLESAERVRLEAAIAAARLAVQEHQEWLVKELQPRAKGEFRIGRELFDERLAFPHVAIEPRRCPLSRRGRTYRYAGENVCRGSPGACGSRGCAAYARRAHRGGTAGRDPGGAESRKRRATARAGVVEFARETLRETTDFVRARNFVTLPDAPLEIIVMPEFQRGVAVAYCDAPGPLERGSARSIRCHHSRPSGPSSRSIPSCANTTRDRSRT